MRNTAITIFSVLFLAGIVFYFGSSLSERQPNFFFEKENEEVTEEDVNILVLGRVAEGQGGKWHLAPGLVDTIILLHYRPEANVVNLISLPRDLYGTFGKYPYKLNEIYYMNEIGNFLEKLPEITGISSDKFVVIDIGAIEKSVDELGGIDIELKNEVVDPISGFMIDSGKQHLSGEDAVWLIRNRNAPQGDFFREGNQHLVIEAFFEKFKTLSKAEKTKFYFEVIPELKLAETNFSIGELIPKFGKVEDLKFNSIVLDFTTGLVRSSYISNGVITESASTTASGTTPIYILVPDEGVDEYAAIREFISERIK